MAQGYFQISKEWKDLLSNWQKNEQKCLKCGSRYYEFDNIGKWACNQHVLDYNSYEAGRFHPKNSWDCCGERYKGGISLIGNGCVRSDHTVLLIPYTEHHDLYIPNSLVDLLVSFNNCIVDQDSVRQLHYNRKGRKEDDYVVRRYDWKNADFRQETGKSIYSKGAQS
jgi:hypothetical protein